jgi:hypothetical protein
MLTFSKINLSVKTELFAVECKHKDFILVSITNESNLNKITISQLH